MLVKIFGGIMAICMFFMSFSQNAIPETSAMEFSQDDSFSPVLRFVVSSDSHIKKLGDNGCQRIVKMLKAGYAAAEADKNHNTLDAALMLGDITDFGLPTSFAAAKESVKTALKDETDFLAVAAKNHDGYLGRVNRLYVSSISGDKADFHKVINGCHFIGLSSSANIFVHYSEKQLKWLDKQLAEAVAADPEKPVFVFHHEHVKDTVYGSSSVDTWGVEFFTDILKKYPQVIDFSGHSHYPANDPRSVWQGEFTAFNDGGLSYYELTVDGRNCQHPEGSDNMAHMLLVEVDAQNRVRVRVCDLNAEEVLAEYLVDNVTEPVKTKYSHETRKAAAKAPVFTAEPKANVSGRDVKITAAAAQAAEGDVVFIYRLEIFNEKGESVQTANKLSDYYKTLESAGVEFNITLESAGKYTAKIVAEDVWEAASEPVSVEFTVK